jgi:hypothetical protein
MPIHLVLALTLPKLTTELGIEERIEHDPLGGLAGQLARTDTRHRKSQTAGYAMSLDEMVLRRMDELIELGQRVATTRRAPRPGHVTSDFVDVRLANEWFASCLNLIKGVFGEDSVHYKRIDAKFEKYPQWPDFDQAFGVLLASKEDYRKGALFNVKKMIEAELFDDFLEQADHLLSSGYYAPAAVIAGGVLEDALRKLCNRAEISLSLHPKLDWMNAELAKRGTYDRLTQKQVTALADLRNKAAHGQWNQFDASHVETMIRDVRDFMLRHFV